MPQRPKKFTPITIKLRQDLSDRLDLYRERTGSPKTFVIEKALGEYLDKVDPMNSPDMNYDNLRPWLFDTYMLVERMRKESTMLKEQSDSLEAKYEIFFKRLLRAILFAYKDTGMTDDFDVLFNRVEQIHPEWFGSTCEHRDTVLNNIKSFFDTQADAVREAYSKRKYTFKDRILEALEFTLDDGGIFTDYDKFFERFKNINPDLVNEDNPKYKEVVDMTKRFFNKDMSLWQDVSKSEN